MPRARPSLAIAACLLLLPALAAAETVRFHCGMNGANEVPPHQTAGTGTVDATLDTTTRMLHYTVAWQNLSGPATMAHFHGPAAPGANAAIVVNLGKDPTSPVIGDTTLTEEQATQLLAGQWYVNVHTAANPPGEIRCQVTRTP
ncbi:MAG TPA: CHRD domain-containing protein [Acetobacteraceae bacterium]|nr:CHRD domain-containing protein [Acetobacteraceae bacterium]